MLDDIFSKNLDRVADGEPFAAPAVLEMDEEGGESSAQGLAVEPTAESESSTDDDGFFVSADKPISNCRTSIQSAIRQIGMANPLAVVTLRSALAHLNQVEQLMGPAFRS